MPGREQAVFSGRATEDAIAEIAYSLGLTIRKQLKVGKRLWGAERKIDIVLQHPDTRQLLGIESKFQSSKGTAEEKFPAIECLFRR